MAEQQKQGQVSKRGKASKDAQPPDKLHLEKVNVPLPLTKWATSEEAVRIVGDVAEKSGATIVLQNIEGGVVFEAKSKTTASSIKARVLLAMHLQYQVKYQEEKQKLEEQKEIDLQQELQREIDQGLRYDFKLDPGLVGLCLGKGGKNIRRAEGIPGITNINVVNDTGDVSIRGTTAEAVAAARELLEFFVRRVPIEPFTSEQVTELKLTTGCKVASTKEGFIDITGTKETLKMAQEVLELQIEYQCKFSALRGEEFDASETLDNLRKAFAEDVKIEPTSTTASPKRRNESRPTQSNRQGQGTSRTSAAPKQKPNAVSRGISAEPKAQDRVNANQPSVGTDGRKNTRRPKTGDNKERKVESKVAESVKDTRHQQQKKAIVVSEKKAVDERIEEEREAKEEEESGEVQAPLKQPTAGIQAPLKQPTAVTDGLTKNSSQRQRRGNPSAGKKSNQL